MEKRNRHFNDEGRFTQIDPLWSKYPSLSPYVRVANNPLTRIDKTGEYWIEMNSKNQWVAYGYPLTGVLAMEAASLIPGGGLAVNLFKRFGFGDNTVGFENWAGSIIPLNKYTQGAKALVMGAGAIDSYREYNWDRQTFELAVSLGYAEYIGSGGMLAISLEKWWRIREKQGETEQEIKDEFKSVQHYYQWDSKKFIDKYGEETYENYHSADKSNQKKYMAKLIRSMLKILLHLGSGFNSYLENLIPKFYE